MEEKKIPSTRIRQKLFLNAYKKNKYNITKACEESGIARPTYYLWMKEERFASKVKDSQEELIDLVESCLVKQIENDSPACTIFFLKTKGKKRGYEEKPTHVVQNTVNWSEVGKTFADAAQSIATKKPED